MDTAEPVVFQGELVNGRHARRGLVALISVSFLATLPSASLSAAAAHAAPSTSTRGSIDATPLAARQPVAHGLVVTFPVRVSAAAVRRDEVGHLSDVAGVAMRYVRPTSGGSFVIDLPAGADATAVAHTLEASGAVASAEPDYIAVPFAVPNDPGFSLQWHFQSSAAYGIGLPTAWDITTGSSNVVVAVLDTGYRPHADFGTRIITDGDYDMITDPASSNDGDGRDADATDAGDYCSSDPNSTSSWHGTHVAGTIGAATNNNVGVAGIDWRAKLLPVRVLGCGGGTFSDIADGIRYAAGISVNGAVNPHPADVINMSLGGYTGGGCGLTMQSAIDDATAAGAIIVVAAGNDGYMASKYSPASCNNVITVGATTRTGDAAYYSNFGPELTVSAPGGEMYRYSDTTLPPTGVLSTLNDGTTTPGTDAYAWYAGTSMAAPHVAGVVSLLLSLKPDLTLAGAKSILAATAHHFAPGNDCAWLGCGAGIVDAGAALTRMRSDLLTVTAPNTAQKWIVGSKHAITWAATTPSSNVKIELLRTGLATVTLRNPVSSSAHTWTWTIPSTTALSTKARIRVTRTLPSGTVITDMSNAYFTIAKS
ncbi:MAG: hypothetical protein JWL83_3156 [Actinomycetia bacterium]|nr:hypothetical protein [Actinomycetes bacterium]